MKQTNNKITYKYHYNMSIGHTSFSWYQQPANTIAPIGHTNYSFGIGSKTPIELYDDWIKTNGLKSIPYQRKAIEWALERELRVTQDIRGGIIADEMGMGKTFMMLGSMIANPKSKTLIVVPSMLMDQWQKLIAKYLNVEPYIHHGKNKDYTRSRLKDVDGTDLKGKNGSYLRYAVHKITKEVNKVNPENYTVKANRVFTELEKKVVVRVKSTRTLKDAPIVLTTYGMIAMRKKVGYRSPVWNINWDRMICDEAHHMRNNRSNNWLGAANTKCQIRWLLTGTPIQNYENDVHSLRALIDYSRTYQDLCLHRSKASVGLELPPISFEEIPILSRDMPDNESNLIEQIHSQLPFADVTLENVDEIIALFEGKGVFPLLTAARQACLYPRLLVDKWYKMLADGAIDGDIQIPRVDSHSKLNAIVNTIASKDKAAQKIIFTHYHAETDRLAALLNRKGFSIGKIDGRTKAKQRKNLLNSGNKHFNSLVLNRLFNGGQLDVRNKIQEYLAAPDILLLQIKSCCEGLNLQSYREVYFTSPHWNPATEDQAVARAHRIGQKNAVKVYRFVTKLLNNPNAVRPNYSLDEYCLFIQRCKRELMEKLKEKCTTSL